MSRKPRKSFRLTARRLFAQVPIYLTASGGVQLRKVAGFSNENDGCPLE